MKERIMERGGKINTEITVPAQGMSVSDAVLEPPALRKNNGDTLYCILFLSREKIRKICFEERNGSFNIDISKISSNVKLSYSCYVTLNYLLSFQAI